MQISDEHKKRYLGRRMLDVEKLRHCVNDNNFDLILYIGHQLKGNGGTFGHPAISLIGATLEEAAFANNKNKLFEIIEKLALYINEKMKVYQ